MLACVYRRSVVILLTFVFSMWLLYYRTPLSLYVLVIVQICECQVQSHSEWRVIIVSVVKVKFISEFLFQT
jgi:hypothetical protein